MSVTLGKVEICDLEMIMNGGFSPLEGYLNENSYRRVLEECRLETGEVWPMPIVLRVSELDSEKVEVGKELLLRDEEGTILAKVDVESKYEINKEEECEKVVGTNDKNHPYVDMLNKTGKVGVGGKVTKVNGIKHYNYEDLRINPEQCRLLREKHGYKKLVAFQTRNPLHRSHIELILRAAVDDDSHILLSPVVGTTQEGDIDPDTRVRCYRNVIKELPEGKCTLVVIPLAMRMAGPREALWHALIRKNYGCSHFIIGRDHAGPSKKHSVTGNSFYGPFDAHNFVSKYSNDIGIVPLLSSEIVYVENKAKYLSTDELEPSDKCLNISGTLFRKMLENGDPIPEWFSYPSVIQELRSSCQTNKGLCLYFVGLSGAGKSTLVRALSDKINELKSQSVTILDGDIVRLHLSKGLGFSQQDRSTNVRRIGYVASEVVKHGGICLCANIAPYEIDRFFNRDLIQQYGSYVEIFVDTPLDICESRDSKGLYHQARIGALKNFTGISDPFEFPSKHDILIDSTSSISDSVSTILSYIRYHYPHFNL